MSAEERYARQIPLLGADSPSLLKEKAVLLCGLGGVGGYVLESLVRAGVGKIIAVDKDVFEKSNLNRQLLATEENIGLYKAEEAVKRAKAINPQVDISAEIVFLSAESVKALLGKYRVDYIADAVDNITAKLCLAEEAEKRGIPAVSCMGTGNKLDSGAFRCADIYETSVCPLARVMRKLLKERGLKALKVIYSTEKPRVRQETVCSVPFVPAAAGLLMAEVIIKDLLGIR